MKNPLINSKHIREYIIYGFLSAACYMVFVIICLAKDNYNYLYLLYIGNAAFMLVIGIHNLMLVNRPYEGKRSMSMLMAGTLTVLIGIIFSVILITLCLFIYFPHVFTYNATQEAMSNAPTGVNVRRPADFLFMLLMNGVVINFAAGSFIALIFSYAGKRNQVKDKPAELTPEIYSLKKDETRNKEA